MAEPVVDLTYDGIKRSQAYREAKELVSKGDFEGALEAIQGMLESTLTQLSDECPDEADLELHEALAPLQYLYGTTLLYSVEESSSSNLATDAPPPGGTHNAGTLDVAVLHQALRPTSSSASAATVDPSASAGDAKAEEEEGDPSAEAAAATNTAEDLQIAWENLESARTILCRMTAGQEERHVDWSLDWAQVYLRLGDLQRLNGNYQGAESDYEHCLRLRTPFLSFHRQVANVRHSLGMICTLIVADAVRFQQQEEATPPKTTEETNAKDGAPPPPRKLTPQELDQYRKKAILHYLQCGRNLAGLIVLEHNKTLTATGSPSETVPERFVEFREETLAAWVAHQDVLSQDNDDDAKVAAHNLSFADLLSKSLAALERLQNELTRLLGDNNNNNEEIKDLRGVLDEIQETMDTTEENAQGIRDVAEIKAAAVAAAAGESEPGAAVTTTIGFGDSTTPPTRVVVGRKKRSATKEEAAGENQRDAQAGEIQENGGAPTTTLVPVRKKKRAAALQVSSQE